MERYAPAPVLRAALRATVSRRAGSEALYLVLGLPLGIAGFYLLIILLVPGILLTASVVGTIAGLGLLIVATQLGRMVGAGHRWLAARCLGSQVTAPAPFRPGTGIIGRIDARLRDGAAWRATGYVLVKFPLAVLGCYVALVAWIGGLFYLTYPAWWWLSGAAVRADHGTGKPAVVMNPLPVGGLQVGTWPSALAVPLLGAAVLLAAPWAVRLFVTADQWLIRNLLGAGRLSERVRELEESRASAVDDSAATPR